MAELIRVQSYNKLAFGNYKLDTKTKVVDFPFKGDLYYVKSFKEITKLEKNSAFVFESNPGTTITDFDMNFDEVSFTVEGNEDAQITLGLLEDTVYEVFIDDESIGGMKTKMSGKLYVNVELNEGKAVRLRIVKG